MKRLRRIGALTAFIAVMTMSTAVIASAAPVPEYLQDREPVVPYEASVRNGDDASASIPVYGFIVPQGGRIIKEDSSKEPAAPGTKNPTSLLPKTDDSGEIEKFMILALFFLFLLLIQKRGRTKLVQ